MPLFLHFAFCILFTCTEYSLAIFFFRIDKNIDGHKDSAKDINEGGSDKAQENTQSKKKEQNEEKKDYPHILKYIKTQVSSL